MGVLFLLCACTCIGSQLPDTIVAKYQEIATGFTDFTKIDELRHNTPHPLAPVIGHHGTILATASTDENRMYPKDIIRLWDVNRGTMRTAYDIPSLPRISQVTFSPTDEQMLLQGKNSAHNALLGLMPIATGIFSQLLVSPQDIICNAFRGERNFVSLLRHRHGPEIYLMGREIGATESYLSKKITDGDMITTAAFAPFGNELAIARQTHNNTRGTVVLYETITGKQTRPPCILGRPARTIHFADTIPQTIVLEHSPHGISCHDLRQPQNPVWYTPNRVSIYDIRKVSSAMLIIMGALKSTQYPEDTHLKIINAATQETSTLTVSDMNIASATILPNEKQIALLSDEGNISVWEFGGMRFMQYITDLTKAMGLQKIQSFVHAGSQHLLVTTRQGPIRIIRLSSASDE